MDLRSPGILKAISHEHAVRRKHEHKKIRIPLAPDIDLYRLAILVVLQDPPSRERNEILAEFQEEIEQKYDSGLLNRETRRELLQLFARPFLHQP